MPEAQSLTTFDSSVRRPSPGLSTSAGIFAHIQATARTSARNVLCDSLVVTCSQGMSTRPTQSPMAFQTATRMTRRLAAALQCRRQPLTHRRLQYRRRRSQLPPESMGRRQPPSCPPRLPTGLSHLTRRSSRPSACIRTTLCSRTTMFRRGRRVTSTSAVAPASIWPTATGCHSTSPPSVPQASLSLMDPPPCVSLVLTKASSPPPMHLPAPLVALVRAASS